MSNETFVAIIICLLLAGLGNLLLGVTSTHQSTLRFQRRLFLVAFAIRFSVSIALYAFGFWTLLGDADASGWSYGATLVSRWTVDHATIVDVIASWSEAFRNSGVPSAGTPGTHLGYYYLLGTIFFITGVSSRLIAAALNGFFGAIIVVFAYRTARTLFSEWVAVRVAWWTCLFPSMIIWSAQTVKEPVVITLEVIALYCCLRLRKSGYALRYVLLGGCAIALMLPFRFYAAYIATAAFGSVLIIPNTGRRARWSAVGLGVFALTIAVVALVLVNSEARIDQFDLTFVQQFRHDIAEGAGSGLNLDVDMHTTTGFSVGTLVGAAYLLLAPFPWELGVGSLRMLLTAPELVVWWWIFFVGVVPGARYVVKTRGLELAPIFVFILGLGLLYSMTFGNIGLVFRQRAQLLPWLFVLAAVGLEQRAIRQSRRLPAQVRFAPRHRPPAAVGRT